MISCVITWYWAKAYYLKKTPSYWFIAASIIWALMFVLALCLGTRTIIEML